MATYIPELNAIGHCPGFAIWLARLVAMSGEATVLALPKSSAQEPRFRDQIDLVARSGIEVVLLDRSTVNYNPRGGAEACEWISGWTAPGKGDRLMLPTLDYLLMAETGLNLSSGITLEGVYHQPRTQLPLVPPFRQLLQRGFDQQERELRKRDWRMLKEFGLRTTFLLDPYEAIGPGRKSMQRCLGAVGSRIVYLPIGSLNTFGHTWKDGCRKELGVAENAPFLVVPGNPDDRKDIGTLIKAWPKVRDRVPGAILGIFGHRPSYVEDWSKIIGEGVVYQEGTLSQSMLLGIVREANAVWAVRSSTVGMSSILDLALQLGSLAIVSKKNLHSAWLTDQFWGIKVIPGDVGSVVSGVARALCRTGRMDPIDLGILADTEVASRVLSGDCILTNGDLPICLR